MGLRLVKFQNITPIMDKINDKSWFVMLVNTVCCYPSQLYIGTDMVPETSGFGFNITAVKKA